jgi:hypothetical protein
MVRKCGGALSEWIAEMAVLFAVASCICGYWSTDAFGLPVGRAYEMVTPLYKGGYGANGIEAVAPDGGSMAFFSKGAFAGAPSSPPGAVGIAYVARRGLSGWSTVPVMPPARIMPYVVTRDVSASLAATIAVGKPGSDDEGTFQTGKESTLLLHDIASPDTEAYWELAGNPLKTLDNEPFDVHYEGASSDLCHVALKSLPLLPEARKTTGQLYELDSGCDDVSALHVVGLNNQHKTINAGCAVELGGREGGSGSTLGAIAADGEEIFFTTSVETKEVKCFTGQLFVRLGESKTIEVSRPLTSSCVEVPCAGATTRAVAHFEGASVDGTKVYFTTRASLVGEDKDEGNDLYAATIGCPPTMVECGVTERIVTSLAQVSHAPLGGEAADVQGVVSTSLDNSHIYFVARGVLTEGANAEGHAPVAGGDNLYVYDGTSQNVAFVADLCSGPTLSGAVEDGRCPSDLNSAVSGVNDQDLWGTVGHLEAQSTADGRYLVFASYGQLVNDDTDDAKDIYRFDSATRRVDRVSVGEDGEDANGNANGSVNDADIPSVSSGGNTVRSEYEMGTRAVSEDGSQIVFVTAEPLSSMAVNGLENVYEWHRESGSDGAMVSLVSSGTSDEPVFSVAMAPAGKDVFFVTSQGLVGADVDGAPDIYDARLGGASTPVSSPREPCAGDSCQGPLTNPAPLLVAGSIVQEPGGNLPPPKKVHSSKAKGKRIKKRGHKTRHGARGRRAGTIHARKS